MKKSFVYFTVILSLIAGFIGAMGYSKLYLQGSAAPVSHKETAYERVMRTGVLRCGYFTFPPLAMKDENTGKLSGVTVDIFNKVAQNLSLKVEWAEEVSFAGAIPGLQTNRYDVVCTPLWPAAARAREVEFVTPEFYAALGVWVRANDKRFDDNFVAINNPSVVISGIDGQIEQAVRDEQFPQAKLITLPGGTDFSESMLNVVTGKADVTFVDRAAGALFESRHPGKLKNIAKDKPLRVFPFSLGVLGGEVRLKNMLDVAVQELHNTGYVENKLREYDPTGLFLPVAKPYEVVR